MTDREKEAREIARSHEACAPRDHPLFEQVKDRLAERIQAYGDRREREGAENMRRDIACWVFFHANEARKAGDAAHPTYEHFAEQIRALPLPSELTAHAPRGLSRDGEAEHGWQPMGDLPHVHGLKFDAYIPGQGRVADCGYSTKLTRSPLYRPSDNRGGVRQLIGATHWMPVPASPKTPDSAGREERSDDPSPNPVSKPGAIEGWTNETASTPTQAPKSTETMSSDVPNDGAETAN